MQEIVIINGPPGAGKTTVARALSALLPGTICIEGDALRAFAPQDARQHLGGGSTYRAAAALARSYLAMGAPRVLFEYVFLRLAHLACFREPLGGLPIHLFTLWAPLDVVEARERERIGRTPLGEAVLECYREIEANQDALGRFLSTDGVHPDRLAEEIHRLVAGGSSMTT